MAREEIEGKIKLKKLKIKYTPKFLFYFALNLNKEPYIFLAALDTKKSLIKKK